MNPRTPFVLAAVSAVLLILAHQPTGAWPLVLVALVPLVRLAEAEGVGAGRRALAAYIGGALLFGVACRWLTIAAWPNLVMMTVFEAMSFPAFVFLHRITRRRLPRAASVAVAWLAIEFVRGLFPWNGYPWLLLGYAWCGPLPLVQAAELFGVSGMTFLAAWANGLLATALTTCGRARALRIVGVVLLPVLLFAYGVQRIRTVRYDSEPGPRILLVQANVPQRLKNSLKTDQVEAMQRRVTREAVAAEVAEGFDLVCWAETMFPYLLHHDVGPESDALDAQVMAKVVTSELGAMPGAWFLTGAITLRMRADGRRETFNSILLFDEDGKRVGQYDKSVLVPGGEFIPMRGILPDFVFDIIRSIAGTLPDLTAGSGPDVLTLETADGRTFRMGPTICYENVYPGFCARTVAGGVDFLLNVSNEAWFGDSAEFDQMDIASRFRAIETRRSLVRATNSGISGLYGATGERLERVLSPGGRDRAVSGHCVVEVPVHAGKTAFVRFGDVVGLLTTFLATLLCLGGLLDRRRYPRSRQD